MPRHEPAEVHSITGAQRSLDDDLHGRMKRYLVSMSIRTACFVLAIVFHGWLRWGCAIAAVVLPYIAVVAANAGRSRPEPHVGYVPPQRAIEGGSGRRIG